MDDPWIFNLAVQNKTDIGSLVFDLVIILAVSYTHLRAHET